MTDIDIEVRARELAVIKLVGKYKKEFNKIYRKEKNGLSKRNK
jgi:hypothetical protein